MATIKLPFSKIKKIDIINVSGGMTASQVIKKYNPDYLINLALYDVKTGTNITNLEDENKASGYLFAADGIGIEGEKKLVWTTFQEAKNNPLIRDFVAGSPNLVEQGKVNIDWGNKYSSYINGSHRRSAIGFNKDELLLFYSESEMSIKKLAEQSQKTLKAEYMINCDGGGSCHLQSKNKVYSSSTRKNASWLLVYMKGENEMLINVDGKEYDFDAFVKDGKTYIQLRDFEKAGYKIGYVNGVPTIEKPSK